MRACPIMKAWNTHMGKYYAPKNFNFWYFFGVLSLLVLVNQLLTGIWLTMSYNPSQEGAFASVEYIMRDVEFGWMIALHALHRRLGVFRRRLSAHVPRPAVRLLSKSRANWCGFSAC